jgi:hypothetical protein
MSAVDVVFAATLFTLIIVVAYIAYNIGVDKGRAKEKSYQRSAERYTKAEIDREFAALLKEIEEHGHDFHN